MMPLLLFNDIEDESSDAVMTQFGLTKRVAIDTNPLPSLNPSDKPFVILGHTQEVLYDYALWKSKKQTLGGFSAAEVAKRLANTLPKKNRDQLKDLYLIACEAGLYDTADKPCYARQLAHELFKQGFTAIAVHAVTSPPPNDTPQYVGMRVELVNRVGLAGALEGLKPGHARAFMTTPEYERVAQEISQLEDALQAIRGNTLDEAQRRSALNRQILSCSRFLQTESRQHWIMDVADLQTELHRPENTFQAQASLQAISATPKQWQAERDRVAKQPLARHGQSLVSPKEPISLDAPFMAQAKNDKTLSAVLQELSCLQQRYRNNKKYLSNMAALLVAMKEKSPHWQQAIFEKMDSYHQVGGIKRLSTNHATSSFYDLLLHLVREYYLHRTDGYDELAETIKKSLPELTIEHAIINKNKEKLAVTLVCRENSKTVLIEFSLTKKEQIITSALMKKKIAQGQRRVEEPKKAWSISPSGDPDKEGKMEEEMPSVLLHHLPAVTHYYQHKNRFHFWPAATQNGPFSPLQGDALKQAILDDFKQKIEACNDQKSLNACTNRLRKTSEFSVLARAQDPITHLFRWLPWVKTASEKAFEAMHRDQTLHVQHLKKNR